LGPKKFSKVLTREDRANLDASLAKIRKGLDVTPAEGVRFAEIRPLIGGQLSIGKLMSAGVRGDFSKVWCTPEERARLSELSKRLEQAENYLKSLLRRLGVSANLEDPEEFWIQLWAEVRSVDFTDEEFFQLSVHELGARLEVKARELNPTGRQAWDPGLAATPLQGIAERAKADPAPDVEKSGSGTESRKAERKKLRDDYQSECKRHGVNVTDEMIAKAANPTTANNKGWSSRSNIQKWLACHPKYEGKPDQRIRNVFLKKPHLSNPQV